jgi:hypothetical protein
VTAAAPTVPGLRILALSERTALEAGPANGTKRGDEIPVLDGA